jgi:hypothetical protein
LIFYLIFHIRIILVLGNRISKSTERGLAMNRTFSRQHHGHGVLKLWGILVLLLAINALSYGLAVTQIFTTVNGVLCQVANGFRNFAIPLGGAALAMVGGAVTFQGDYRPLQRVMPILLGTGITVGALTIIAVIAVGVGACAATGG